METDRSIQITAFINELQALKPCDAITINELQQRYPDIKLTLCWQDEVGEREPFAMLDSADVHLVASSPNQCSCLTFDITATTGLLIALQD